MNVALMVIEAFKSQHVVKHNKCNYLYLYPDFIKHKRCCRITLNNDVNILDKLLIKIWKLPADKSNRENQSTTSTMGCKVALVLFLISLINLNVCAREVRNTAINETFLEEVIDAEECDRQISVIKANSMLLFQCKWNY